MIILGIDPGLVNIGWALINSEKGKISFIESGTIRPKTDLKIKDRIVEIYDQISHICKYYKPNVCAIEETFISNNAGTSLKLGHARGAIILTIALEGIDIYEYAATLVKKTITGVGRADKFQIETMVKYILPTAKFNSEHASDAIAIAICHANHTKFR